MPLPSTVALFATGVSDPARWGSAGGALRRYIIRRNRHALDDELRGIVKRASVA